MSIFERLSNQARGAFYGWRMIAVSCAIRVLGGGLHAYGLSVFFLPVTQELGLTRTATSLVFSLARAQGALEGPIAGYCIDRYGPRPVIAIAIALAGIGYLLLAGVHSYAALLIVYMGVISISYQAGFMDATMALANTWFIRKRALAMSIISGSISLGGALLTPLLAYAVHTWGWRMASIGAGVAFLIAGLPLSLLIHRSPESLELLPDGEPPQQLHQSEELGYGQQRATEGEFSLRETLHTPQFWLLAVATSLRVICSSVRHADPSANRLAWRSRLQTPAHGGDDDARQCIDLFSISRPRVLAVVDRGFAIQRFRGFVSRPWATIGDFFGRKNFAKIRGSMSFLYTWGSVLGPVPAGAVYDRTQSYQLLFGILLSISWLTALLYFILFQPKPKPIRLVTAP